MSNVDEAISRTEQSAADALFSARENLRPIAPVREAFEIVDPTAAYRVQEANTRRWLANGRKVSGRKIGLTSKAVQAQLGVSEPDYGMLWSDSAYADGDAVPFGRFMQAKIEAEIAFVMGGDLTSADISLASLMRSIAYCVPAIEIVDSAIENWNIRLTDTIADNASGGAYVIGASPRLLSGVDLRLCGMLMTRSDEVVSSGLGAACLGHPLKAALWLARKMNEVGRPLLAGDIVLSGALGPMVTVEKGQRFNVEIQGFDALTISFE